MWQGAERSEAGEEGTRAYRNYVLFLLVLLYSSNFIDRTILGVLAQPIKTALKLEDWQLGLLGGTAFVILYAGLGLPVARLAERRSRVAVISAALAVWSGMTALCAVAQSYTQLLLARIGVGVGEAGCIPAANSLIADYFPPQKRASAAGVFSLGIPIGTVCGALLAGWIAQRFGWRAAFLLVGAPGLALALIVRLTVREPVRGRFDRSVASEAPPPFGAVLERLWSKPAFLHIAFGSSLSSFSGYAIAQFAIPFLLRGYRLSLIEAAGAFAAIGGIATAVGVGGGGFLTDWAAKHDRRFYVLIPAAGFVVAAPFYMAGFLQRDLGTLAILVAIPAVLQYIYFGPIFALTQNMVEPRMRATAAAILTLVINLIGYGLGPLVVGWASDQFAAHAYAGVDGYFRACPKGLPPPGALEAQAALCRAAAFTGLQRALVMASAVYLWAGLHFALAARTLRRDLDT